MATVTVLSFPTPDGAAEAQGLVKDLQKQQIIKLRDAAIVSWPAGRRGPATKQLANLVNVGAMSGLFWGSLFGLIFVTPLFGLAVGAAVGALSGAVRDYGIDDDFIRDVRDHVTEGTSALFLMTADPVVDRAVNALKTLQFEIVSTTLSKDQEQSLREAFGV